MKVRQQQMIKALEKEIKIGKVVDKVVNTGRRIRDDSMKNT